MKNPWPTAIACPPDIEAYLLLPDRASAREFLLRLDPAEYDYWRSWGLDPEVLIQAMSTRTGYDELENQNGITYDL